MQIEAWRVHDSGLVAAPGRFRRLSGRVRHHQGEGDAWPVNVVLEVARGELRVTGADGGLVGVWPVAEATARRSSAGPPVAFVVEVPGTSQLLAAAAGDAVEELLAALAR
jgi:hypothetical protein